MSKTFRSPVVFLLALLLSVAPLLSRAQRPVRYATSGANYNLNLVSTPSFYDGVALVNTGFSLGSAALIGDNVLLTVAHVVTDTLGNPLNSLDVTFELAGGPITLASSRVTVHEAYNSFTASNDIALIFLSEAAPVSIPRYSLYSRSDEIGRTFDGAGYGVYGTGAMGEIGFDGRKRSGRNRYEAFGSEVEALFFGGDTTPRGSTLAYDFDDGTSARDAMGFYLGSERANLGLGAEEANSTPGDSGSPTFIDGKIAGIVSFGFGGDFGVTTDNNFQTDSSFGEFSVDTRVSYYRNWIAANGGPAVPGPAALPLFAVGVGFCLRRVRRRTKR